MSSAGANETDAATATAPPASEVQAEHKFVVLPSMAALVAVLACVPFRNALKDSVMALLADYTTFLSTVLSGPLALVGLSIRVPIGVVSCACGVVAAVFSKLHRTASGLLALLSFGRRMAPIAAESAPSDDEGDDGSAGGRDRPPRWQRRVGPAVAFATGAIFDRAVAAAVAGGVASDPYALQPGSSPVPWRHQPLFPQIAKAPPAFVPPPIAERSRRPALRAKA